MKANLISEIFFLLICFCAFASVAFTQEEKPQVIEFAKVAVREGETEIDKFIEPLEKFISSLKNESETTKGYIEVPENTELGKKIKSVVADAGLESRVRFWKAKKYPEYYWFRSPVSFYFIPQGAEAFRIYAREPCLCTNLDVTAPKIVTDQKSVLTFNAKVGNDDIDCVTYNWYVSAGKILAGQGTKTIKVDAEGANEVTATVQIGGFCDNCARTGQAIAEIKDK